MVEVVATIKFQHRSVLEVLKDADQFGVYIKYNNEIVFDHWRASPTMDDLTYMAQAMKPHLMINCMRGIVILSEADLETMSLIVHLIDALKK